MKIENNYKGIYVCSPLRGDIEGNLKRAYEYGQFVYRQGCVPVIPHLRLAKVLDDNKPEDRKKGIEIGLRHLELCDEIWVFGERISEGMAGEIEKAKALGKPIRYFTETMEER